MAEDERTTMAKDSKTDVRCASIDATHSATEVVAPPILQPGKNVGYAMSVTFRRAIRHLKSDKQRVRFQSKQTIATFQDGDEAVRITYDSGADGNYISKADRKKAGLPILQHSTKRVGVANGGTSSGKFVTKLPFP